MSEDNMRYQCVVIKCCDEGHNEVGHITESHANINIAYKGMNYYNTLFPYYACRVEVREQKE